VWWFKNYILWTKLICGGIKTHFQEKEYISKEKNIYGEKKSKKRRKIILVIFGWNGRGEKKSKKRRKIIFEIYGWNGRGEKNSKKRWKIILEIYGWNGRAKTNNISTNN